METQLFFCFDSFNDLKDQPCWEAPAFFTRRWRREKRPVLSHTLVPWSVSPTVAFTNFTAAGFTIVRPSEPERLPGSAFWPSTHNPIVIGATALTTITARRERIKRASKQTLYPLCQGQGQQEQVQALFPLLFPGRGLACRPGTQKGPGNFKVSRGGFRVFILSTPPPCRGNRVIFHSSKTWQWVFS